jgi:hypothetical protein
MSKIVTIIGKGEGNLAAVLEKPQVRLKIIDRPIPKPGPNEIVVRNHAGVQIVLSFLFPRHLSSITA